MPEFKKTGAKDNRNVGNGKRANPLRPYPAGSFADSLELGDAINQHSPGGKIRRLTLMEKMNRSASSSATRQLITNSAKYGITEGSYAADWLELTQAGKVIFDDSSLPQNVLRAKFSLSIENISPFNRLYNEHVGRRLPAAEVMRDFLDSAGEEMDDFVECTDLFTVNVTDLRLLRIIGGSETLISIDQAIDDLSEDGIKATPSTVISTPGARASVDQIGDQDWEKICFYITPIGDDSSDQRKHADLFLGYLVEPANSELGLRVVRADKIGQSGMISAQILEHVKRSKLVIVDLSFLNPNVFYEMALRHACKTPVVHIIRKSDRLPFDVNQMRCIFIDNSDIYSMIPKLQTYRAEIATQARKALEDPEHGGNPITVFYPAFWH